MSDEAPGGDAPGVGVEERERNSTAVTSGEQATEPTATADADAGVGEAAPASSGAEGGVGGADEGGVDASGASLTAPARADDEGASGTRPELACGDGACVPWEDAGAGAVLGCGVASHAGGPRV